jgi:chromosome segregation ATPase
MTDQPRIRTHWEGCWREHLDCAVAEVERLKKLIGNSHRKFYDLDAKRIQLADEIATLREAEDEYVETLARWRRALNEAREENARFREALERIKRVDQTEPDEAMFHKRWETPWEIARAALKNDDNP